MCIHRCIRSRFCIIFRYLQTQYTDICNLNLNICNWMIDIMSISFINIHHSIKQMSRKQLSSTWMRHSPSVNVQPVSYQRTVTIVTCVTAQSYDPFSPSDFSCIQYSLLHISRTPAIQLGPYLSRVRFERSNKCLLFASCSQRLPYLNPAHVLIEISKESHQKSLDCPFEQQSLCLSSFTGSLNF